MATPKRTASAGRKIPINVAGSPGARGPITKVETKHVAIVSKIKCGHWYKRHYHYTVNVVEVLKSDSLEKIRTTAERAQKIVSRFTRKEIMIIHVEEVELASQEKIKEMGSKLFESVK